MKENDKKTANTTDDALFNWNLILQLHNFLQNSDVKSSLFP